MVEGASIVVRELVAEVSRVVNKNIWNVEKFLPGEFVSAGGEDFKPELDAYQVWVVELVHELHIGQSIWSSGIMPHVIEIGKVYVRP